MRYRREREVKEGGGGGGPYYIVELFRYLTF